MTESNELKEAKLITVEDGLAEFVFCGSFNNEEEMHDGDVFFWPEERLPKGIQPGDEVIVNLDFKNKEEKVLQIKKTHEKELKQHEMRQLLEELVN
ncbi:hypothetical protein ACFL3T_03095 [Patescibacteria group bacterium]